MSGGLPVVFDGPWVGMDHSFSALMFTWCSLFIPSFPFHEDTNHIGLEPILMMSSKTSTSVVTLFLNQPRSGELGIITSPGQLWKSTLNSQSLSFTIMLSPLFPSL